MSIYLDYNATTPIAPSVIQKITSSLSEEWGNPSSSYAPGVTSKKGIDKARNHIATMIGANSQDIVFTSGGTEANNMVILGIVQYYNTWIQSSSTGVMLGDNLGRPHVITTNVEHDATILPLRHLERRGEIDVTVIPVCCNGCASSQEVLSHIQRRTCLVTVMLANNETGVIMPVSEIGKSLKKLNKVRQSQGLIKVLFHTDAAQAIGKIDVDADFLHVDYMTIVGHKFYGPRIGCLYIRGLGVETPLFPLMYGGGQERGYKPGTENTAMIVGLGEAARLVCENLQSYNKSMKTARDYLERKLQEVFGESGVVFNCCSNNVDRLPNTCNVSLVGDGLSGPLVLSKCQRVMASIGAACHAQNKPSGILVASGVPPVLATNAIRLSVGRDTSKSDLDAAVTDLQQAVWAVVQATHRQKTRGVN